MWINQPGKAYGPGGKGRVGMNGGAHNGWSVAKPVAHTGGWQVAPPAQSPWTQVHPVPPGFNGTQVQQGPAALHQMVQKVNLAAALQRILKLRSQTAASAPPGPRGVAGQPGAAALVALPSPFHDPRAQGGPLGGSLGVPRPVAPGPAPVDSGVGLVNAPADPYQMPQDSQDLVGPYLAQQQQAQQAAAARAAMVQRLLASRMQ